MIKRYLQIKNFRNLGIGTETKIMLNTSFEKGKMGNLVILVGENGAGKSNVLAALKQFGKQSLSTRDITNLEYGEEYQNPQLSMVTEYEKKQFIYKIVYGSNDQIIPGDDLIIINNSKTAKEICAILNEYNSQATKWLEILNDPSSTDDGLRKVYLEMVEQLRVYKNNGSHGNYEAVNKIKSEYPEVWENLSKNNKDIYKSRFEADLKPNIIEYVEKNINNDAISCLPDSINSFIRDVLESIGFPEKDIHTAYEKFRQQNNRKILSDLQGRVNAKIHKISDDFNKLYRTSDEKFNFELYFDPNTISFTLSKGAVPLTLEYQSVGFMWFFNLYFNVLIKNKLNPGDILIMDEPANGLHVSGMKELRNFLKEYAHKADITIVLSTNLPFLISEDNLDELRLVKSVGGKSVIENDFSTVCLENPDALADVCKALTVDHHILSDPQKILVFVEGITDYNYLTYFKNLLGDKYEKISFIPIGGLGGSEGRNEYQKQLLKELQRIGKKRDAFLLADGDNAGKSIKALNGDNKDFRVLLLTDVDSSYAEIEKLFSNEDITKFEKIEVTGEKVYKKSSAFSSNVKKYSAREDFSGETIANFQKLFDAILAENE